MIHFKPEVRFSIPFAMMHASRVVESVFAEYGNDDTWITSGNDGEHKNGSLHYIDRALDFRIKDLPREARAQAVARITELLSPTYDVLWESVDTDNEHLHIEYDPK